MQTCQQPQQALSNFENYFCNNLLPALWASDARNFQQVFEEDHNNGDEVFYNFTWSPKHPKQSW